MSDLDKVRYSLKDLLDILPLNYKEKHLHKANTKYCKVFGCFNKSVYCCIADSQCLCKKHEYIYHYLEKAFEKLEKSKK